LGGIAFQDVAVERVEGEKVLIELAVHADLRKSTAFRRIGIDIVEMMEPGQVFQVAKSRHAMAFARLGRPCRRDDARHARERKRTGGIAEEIAARDATVEAVETAGAVHRSDPKSTKRQSGAS